MFVVSAGLDGSFETALGGFRTAKRLETYYHTSINTMVLLLRSVSVSVVKLRLGSRPGQW